MSTIRVRTENATYIVDEDEGTVQRTEASHKLPHDGECLPYSYSYVVEGRPAEFGVMFPDGREKIRITTTVQSIETLDDPFGSSSGTLDGEW